MIKNKLKFWIFVLLFLSLIIFCFNYVYAGEGYDPEILDMLNKTEQVRVIVDLIDNSNISIVGTKEERRNLSIQKDEWFKPVIDEVLATLSEEEFKLKRKSSNGFSGTITKEGFDKLINNDKVGKVYIDTTGSLTLDEEQIIDERILEEFNKTDEVQIIVGIIDNSNITISPTDPKEKQVVDYEKRKDFLKNEVETILSRFTENEFRLERIFESNSGFVGNITKRGFNKLVGNPYVKEIYLQEILYIASTPEIDEESKADIVKLESKPKFKIFLILISIILVLYLMIKKIKKRKKYSEKG